MEKATEACDKQRADIPSAGGLKGDIRTTTENLGAGSSQYHQPSFEQGFNQGWKQGVHQSQDPADRIFAYRQPTEMQSAHLEAVRDAAKQFLRTLMKHAPHCADRTAAIRKIREAVMTANFAIVTDGINIS